MKTSRRLITYLCMLTATTGCVESEPVELFPGQWSGDVRVSEHGVVDIETTLHLQLFEEDSQEVSGWFYHEGGHYTIQKIYSTAECDPWLVWGEFRDKDESLIFDCLTTGSSCIEAELTASAATLQISYSLVGFSVSLDDYEMIDEKYQDTFTCLR